MTPLESKHAGTWYAGVDGCHDGWIAVLLHFAGDTLTSVRHRLCTGFAQIIELPERPARTAVDIPIGLLDRARHGGRDCDKAARRLLVARRNSVFSPPVRTVLSARDYSEALARNRASSEAHIGISRQTWGITPKIREVDGCMTPDLQERIVEAHPELAFLALAGRPMQHNKKHTAGYAERCNVLREHYGSLLPDIHELRKQYGARRLAYDDILDACALALTARRVHLGKAQRLPDNAPPIDA
ncbi:MAG: DUF429 domain-containing protein, partial [Gammaproteobacteria bacterium]